MEDFSTVGASGIPSEGAIAFGRLIGSSVGMVLVVGAALVVPDPVWMLAGGAVVGGAVFDSMRITVGIQFVDTGEEEAGGGRAVAVVGTWVTEAEGPVGTIIPVSVVLGGVPLPVGLGTIPVPVGL